MTDAGSQTGVDGGETGRPRRGVNSRSVARLLAVQALYQMDLTAGMVETVVDEFVRFRLGREANRGLFLDLVRGVAAQSDQLSDLVGGALGDQDRVERLEIVLRAIMLCGAYELLSRRDVPARVTITEYVEVAHSFYGGKEPALVNGVLDRLGRTLRGEEFGEPGDDTAADTRGAGAG